MSRLGARGGALLAVLVASGCRSLLGDFAESGAGGATAKSGSGGAGGGAGGGSTACSPGNSEPCYDGPAGTEGHGVCAGGTRTCGSDGTFGVCVGEKLPAPKDDCAKAIDANCDGYACSALLWGAADGDPTTTVVVQSLAVDAAGNVAIAGWFQGFLDIGAVGALVQPDGSLFVGKLDPQGHGLWLDGIGYAQPPTTTLAVAFDAAGDVFVAGSFQGSFDFAGQSATTMGEDVMVAKYDPAGNRVWGEIFGDASAQHATGLAVGDGGALVVTGLYAGALDLGGGVSVSHPGADLDVFVARLEPQKGKALWVKSFGDPAVDEAAAHVAVAKSGAVALAGGFTGTLNLGGADLAAPSDLDVYVGVLDANGGHVASKRFGGAGDQLARDVAVDAEGALFVTGSNRGALDFGLGQVGGSGPSAALFLAKLDASLAPKKSVGFAGAGDAEGVALGVDALGEIAILGTTTGKLDLGGGPLGPSSAASWPFLLKVDASFAHLWSRAFAVTGTATAIDLAVRQSPGVLAATGSLDGSIELGGKAPFALVPPGPSFWLGGFAP